MDINMGGINGIEATKADHRRAPRRHGLLAVHLQPERPARRRQRVRRRRLPEQRRVRRPHPQVHLGSRRPGRLAPTRSGLTLPRYTASDLVGVHERFAALHRACGSRSIVVGCDREVVHRRFATTPSRPAPRTAAAVATGSPCRPRPCTRCAPRSRATPRRRRRWTRRCRGRTRAGLRSTHFSFSAACCRCIAAAASTALAAWSSIATGAPNTAITASPTNCITVPPAAMIARFISARCALSWPGQPGRIGLFRDRRVAADVGHHHGDAQVLRLADLAAVAADLLGEAARQQAGSASRPALRSRRSRRAACAAAAATRRPTTPAGPTSRTACRSSAAAAAGVMLRGGGDRFDRPAFGDELQQRLVAGGQLAVLGHRAHEHRHDAGSIIEPPRRHFDDRPRSIGRLRRCGPSSRYA